MGVSPLDTQNGETKVSSETVTSLCHLDALWLGLVEDTAHVVVAKFGVKGESELGGFE